MPAVRYQRIQVAVPIHVGQGYGGSAIGFGGRIDSRMSDREGRMGNVPAK
jgi:hypothetical protein